MNTFDFVLIAVLAGGGEIREPATAADCIAANRMQMTAIARGGRLFAFDRDGVKRTAVSFMCVPAEKKEVPTS